MSFIRGDWYAYGSACAPWSKKEQQAMRSAHCDPEIVRFGNDECLVIHMPDGTTTILPWAVAVRIANGIIRAERMRVAQGYRGGIVEVGTDGG